MIRILFTCRKTTGGRHAERALQYLIFPYIPADHQRNDDKQPEKTGVGKFYSVKPAHFGKSSLSSGACGSCLVCITKLMAFSMLNSLSSGSGFSLANLTRSAKTKVRLNFSR